MKKVYTIIIFLLASCLSENGVDQGGGDTFIRYYNGGNNDTAQSLEETPDKGWIIMANTRVQKAEADVPHYKIKLIRTDSKGNPVWIKMFPAIDQNDKNYSGSQLQLNPSGGYVICGEDIKSETNSKTLILTVDDNGELTKPPVSFGAFRGGKGVGVSASGTFQVLSVSGTQAMRLNEINNTTLLPVNPADTAIVYLAGETALAKKVFIDTDGKAVWAGMAVKNGLTGIRLIKAKPDRQLTEFDYLFSEPTFDEVATDFCRFGGDFAIIGSTNKKPGSNVKGTDTDILFKRVSLGGDVLSSQSFPFGDGTSPDGQNDTGNSISSTQDGGLILLSSVNSAAFKGNTDTDYYLIKINAFGDKVWASSFGSRYKDDATVVRQSTDGGYVVLGTTTQGQLKLVTLIKTNKEGKIE